MDTITYLVDLGQNIGRVFMSIRAFDIVDILLMTTLVFMVIKFMKETRAEQLLKGIGILVLLYFVANTFQLKAMSFLMENFFQAGLVAVVVVFQPEFRRILEKVGGNKVVSSIANNFQLELNDPVVSDNKNEAINGIVEACEYLASEKRNSLVIIERDTALDDVAEGAVLIDAVPSQNMLRVLYTDLLTLNMGDVIIRDYKIYAVGCNKEKYLSGEYSSRYEAAVSISKSYNAVVIHISEEGQITIIDKGKQIVIGIKDTPLDWLKRELPKYPDNSRMSLAEAKEQREAAIVGIAEGCDALHNTCTGALIVIERNTKLGEIISDGTAIDAVPGKNLFEIIFKNKAPLHDGAMIIRGNRICAAKCILPSPDNRHKTLKSNNLGSRHRAAIGMSDKSDAIVIVVSEETGKISVAENGELTRDYTKEALIELLRKRLPEASVKTSKRREKRVKGQPGRNMK